MQTRSSYVTCCVRLRTGILGLKLFRNLTVADTAQNVRSYTILYLNFFNL